MKKDFLSNAPLKEVLFEVQWDLEYVEEANYFYDKGFEKALLNFTNSCQGKFGEASILKPDNIPYTAFVYRVTHRFFKELGKHPLYQLGPGVFTVNDNNKNYKWVDFIAMVSDGISCLRNSYDKELILNNVQLRYVDRVDPLVFGDMDKFDFLSRHLNIQAESYSFINGTLENISFAKSFSLEDSNTLNLIVSTGVDNKTKQDVIEWHTIVTNNKRLSWKQIHEWADKAHEVCSSTFKNMVSDELYEYFSQEYIS